VRFSAPTALIAPNDALSLLSEATPVVPAWVLALHQGMVSQLAEKLAVPLVLYQGTTCFCFVSGHDLFLFCIRARPVFVLYQGMTCFCFVSGHDLFLFCIRAHLFLFCIRA
jgi:hypothetical protein